MRNYQEQLDYALNGIRSSLNGHHVALEENRIQHDYLCVVTRQLQTAESLIQGLKEKSSSETSTENKDR